MEEKIYFDEPREAVGAKFQFISGAVYLQGASGKVDEIIPSPNAAGKPGFVVVWTFAGRGEQQQQRTTWSYFKEHARRIL